MYQVAGLSGATLRATWDGEVIYPGASDLRPTNAFFSRVKYAIKVICNPATGDPQYVLSIPAPLYTLLEDDLMTVDPDTLADLTVQIAGNSYGWQGEVMANIDCGILTFNAADNLPVSHINPDSVLSAVFQDVLGETTMIHIPFFGSGENILSSLETYSNAVCAWYVQGAAAIDAYPPYFEPGQCSFSDVVYVEFVTDYNSTITIQIPMAANLLFGTPRPTIDVGILAGLIDAVLDHGCDLAGNPATSFRRAYYQKRRY